MQIFFLLLDLNTVQLLLKFLTKTIRPIFQCSLKDLLPPFLCPVLSSCQSTCCPSIHVARCCRQLDSSCPSSSQAAVFSLPASNGFYSCYCINSCHSDRVPWKLCAPATDSFLCWLKDLFCFGMPLRRKNFRAMNFSCGEYLCLEHTQ